MGNTLTLADWIAKRDKISDAIDAIVDGNQAFAIRDRTYTKADLETLERMLDRAEARIRKLDRGGGIRRKHAVISQT